jgi:hypothetical protein
MLVASDAPLPVADLCAHLCADRPCFNSARTAASCPVAACVLLAPPSASSWSGYLLFRWFVGLGIDDPGWGHSTFSKNRDRLLVSNVATEFLATLLDQPKVRRLLSRSAGRTGCRDLHGERRRNLTTPRPPTQLPGYSARDRQGGQALLHGRPLMENRSGQMIGAHLTAATGHAEHEAAAALIAAVPGRHLITLRAIAPNMPRASLPT